MANPTSQQLVTTLRTVGIVVAVVVGVAVLLWFVAMCIHEFSDTNPADVFAPLGSYFQDSDGNCIPIDP